MRRFFVKNILFVIAVNVLVKPIWVFFIDRVVQNRVGAESYGTYSTLMSFSIIFSIILDFGIASYNSRTISQRPDELKTLFSSMLTARILLILLYTVIVLVVAFVLRYSKRDVLMLCGVLLIQSLNGLLLFIRSNVAALQKFKTDGILSVTDKFLMIVVCGFLLVYPNTGKHFRIEWFIIAQACCYFTACIIAYMVLRHIHEIKLRISFHAPTILRVIRESFPYALLIFQMSVYNRADIMIMERICVDGKDQAGIWAAAFRLIDQANMFGLMFATVLLPLFGRMLSQKQDVQPIVKVCVNMMLPLSFMVAIAGIFFSGDIMHLLYHNSAFYNTPGVALNYEVVFACLIASFPAWCLMYVYSTLLTANGSLKTLNIIAFVGVIVNLSLNFYLIPQYKALGGAITSFITQTGVSIAFMVFAARIIKLPFNIKWALAHIGYLVLILLLAYGVLAVMRDTSWILQLGTFGIICVGLMFIFRFISIQGIQQLVSKRV